MIRAPLITRLDESDRALYLRWVIDASVPMRETRAWTLLTHLGGLWMSVAAVLVPALAEASTPFLRWVAVQAGLSLLLSHLVVQAIKRCVLRQRPCERIVVGPHVVVPDRFSFPSGHSCAVMSVAFVYAVAYPWLAWPLLMLSMMVGISRVRLGVHYPGDVFAGQAIAIATGVLVMALL
jgi:undecaprenyl-diphosphatase